MSDRVVVMREGRIAGVFDRAGLTAETLVARRHRQPRRGGRVRCALNRDILLAAIVVVMIVGIGFITPAFVSPRNLVALFNDTVDPDHAGARPDDGDPDQVRSTCRSAANIALTGVLVALVNAAYPGGAGAAADGRWRPASASPSAPSTASMVWLVGIPPIVVTLGTLSIYRGLAFVASGGTSIVGRQMSRGVHRHPARRVPRPAGDVVVRHRRRSSIFALLLRAHAHRARLLRRRRQPDRRGLHRHRRRPHPVHRLLHLRRDRRLLRLSLGRRATPSPMSTSPAASSST